MDPAGVVDLGIASEDLQVRDAEPVGDAGEVVTAPNGVGEASRPARTRRQDRHPVTRVDRPRTGRLVRRGAREVELGTGFAGWLGSVPACPGEVAPARWLPSTSPCGADVAPRTPPRGDPWTRASVSRTTDPNRTRAADVSRPRRRCGSTAEPAPAARPGSGSGSTARDAAPSSSTRVRMRWRDCRSSPDSARCPPCRWMAMATAITTAVAIRTKTIGSLTSTDGVSLGPVDPRTP
jgi:hypothetical protein